MVTCKLLAPVIVKTDFLLLIIFKIPLQNTQVEPYTQVFIDNLIKM